MNSSGSHLGMLTSPRVRPPIRLRALVIWHAIFGIASSIAMVWSHQSNLLLGLVLLAPPLLLGHMSTQSLRAASVFGFVLGCSCGVGVFVQTQALVGGLAIEVLPSWSLGIGLALLAGVLLAIINVAASALLRKLFPIVTQDGWLCPGCAYPAGRCSSSNRCPECGASAACIGTTPGAVSRLILLADRYAVRIGGTATIIAAACGYLLLQLHSNAAVLRTVVPNGTSFRGFMVDGGGMRSDWPAAGMTAHLVGTSQTLVVMFTNSPMPDQPSLQVSVQSHSPNDRSAMARSMSGLPIAFCDFSASQASGVLKDGLPAELIRHLVSASRSAGAASGPAWTPLRIEPSTVLHADESDVNSAP